MMVINQLAMHRLPTSAKVAAAAMARTPPPSVLEVPVIDIAALMALPDNSSVVSALHESNPALHDVIANVRSAATEWGFFYIQHHGVDSSQLQRFQAAMRAFFSLPSASKDALRRSSSNSRGYFDNELTKNKVDWKEGLDFAGRQEDGPADSSVYQRLGGDCNQWPSERELPGFRAVMAEYFTAMEHISRRLIQVLAVALGERVDFFDQFFHQSVRQSDAEAVSMSDNTSFLRLNHYPVSPEPDKTMGVYHHTDAGAVTVLLQDDDVASLQVLHRESQQWALVPPIEDTFVINIGDMLQVWSNDKFTAPLHRVLANGAKDRFSAPFFYNPSYSAVVEPIVVKEGDAPRYRGLSWREFRLRRFQGDYAEHGEEVQIAHFKLDT